MLAITGGKGGCGKTTTTLGLARAFVQRRRRPVVVDCDLDTPNLHLRADVPLTPGLNATGALVEQAHASPVVPGVDVIPTGDVNPDSIMDVLGTIDNQTPNRPVLLDCPAGAGESAIQPIRVARGAIVVATSGTEGIEDAVKTAAMARAVGTPVQAAVVSRVRELPPGLDTVLGTPFIEAIPPVNTPLSDRESAVAYASVVDAVRSNI